MKNQIKVTIVFLLLAGLFSFSYSQAPAKLSKQSVKGYIEAIKSENDGLRKSAIFYAGLYKIKEVTELLASRYEETEDVNEKILIAFSLYMIEEPGTLDNTALDERVAKFNKLTAGFYHNFSEKMLMEAKE